MFETPYPSQIGRLLVDDHLRTPAWLMLGLTRSVPGELRAVRERLSFQAEDGTRFNVALVAVRDVNFPWYYFGAGVQLTVEARRYRLSFVRPTSEGGSVMDISAGREAGRAWKKFLVGDRA